MKKGNGKIKGIGVDIAEIGRFRPLIKQKKMHSLDKIFSKNEREYCLSYKDAAPHFAATFAGKEAVRKASGDFSLPFKELEIRRDKRGKPEVWIRGKRAVPLLVSITHSRDIACAIAISREL